MTLILFFSFRLNLMAQERDPFVSSLDLQKQKAEKQFSLRMDLSEFVLKGIIWNNKVSVAIINDELFAVGDDCRGLQVEAIGKDSVTLTDGSESFSPSMATFMDCASCCKLVKGSSSLLNTFGRPARNASTSALR